MISCFSAARGVMFVAGLVLGSATAFAAANKTKWLRVSTPQFTVITSVSEKDAIAWTGEFAQFVAALQSLVPVDASRLPRLTLVVFANEKEFARYRPLGADGKPEEVAGFFSRRDSWAVAGLARAGWREETRATIFHEGTHWLLTAFEGPNPVWLEEGLAEVFSTFELRKNEVRWGRAIDDHVMVLNQLRPMPIERLLFLPKSELFTGGSEGMFRTGMAYAQSWAFVHYLMFGKNNLPQNAMINYVRLLRGVIHPDEAFKQAFGQDYAEVDRKLGSYLSGGRYYVAQRPLAELPPLQAEPATASDVEEALARLSLVAGRKADALKHAEAFRELSADSPVVYELLGQLHQEAGNNAAALAAYREAARLKSRDFRPYYEIARDLHMEATEQDGSLAHLSAEDARKVANGYERVINLNPHFQPAYQGLAGVVELVPPGNSQDGLFLQQGRSLFPDDGMIQLGLAVVEKQNGDSEKAAQMLDAVLKSGSPQPIDVRKYASRLETAWAAQDIFGQTDKWVNEGKYDEALALLDQRLAEHNPRSFHQRLRAARERISSLKQLDAVKAAWGNRDWKEARRLINEILESDAPAILKNQMRRRLEELDRRNLGASKK